MAEIGWISDLPILDGHLAIHRASTGFFKLASPDAHDNFLLTVPLNGDVVIFCRSRDNRLGV